MKERKERNEKMSYIYIIKGKNHIWGCVENRKDVAPFVILTEILKVDDFRMGQYSLIDYLGLTPTTNKEEVCTYFKELSEPLQELILNQLGIYIEEVHLWNYQEYKHNKG